MVDQKQAESKKTMNIAGKFRQNLRSEKMDFLLLL